MFDKIYLNTKTGEVMFASDIQRIVKLNTLDKFLTGNYYCSKEELEMKEWEQFKKDNPLVFLANTEI